MTKRTRQNRTGRNPNPNVQRQKSESVFSVIFLNFPYTSKIEDKKKTILKKRSTEMNTEVSGEPKLN